MAESIWWPEEHWWEKKVLPLGFITLSLRQLATILSSLGLAFLVSLPFQFPIAGFSFGGRAVVFFIIFGTGYMIAHRRVKLLPMELQAAYVLRRDGIKKLKARLLPLLGLKKPEPPPQNSKLLLAQEMVVEDFKNPVPLVISERVRDLYGESRVILFLDGIARGQDEVSPQKPSFRLLYYPLPEDIGTHQLTVKLEGSAEELVSIRLVLQAKTAQVYAPSLDRK